MNTLKYVLKKYNVSKSASPIRLPGKRDSLCTLFKELGYKRGAEIGTDRGYYATELCLANPELKLYCIDPWEVYESKVYDPFCDNQSLLTRHFRRTKQRLASYNCEIIRKFSMDAVKDFKPNSLDFVYIDGNHDFDHVLEDITEWEKRVRPGGIVSGHDYEHYKYKEVGDNVSGAVNTYLDTHKIIKRLFILGKYCPSWFFIKK